MFCVWLTKEDSKTHFSYFCLSFDWERKMKRRLKICKIFKNLSNLSITAEIEDARHRFQSCKHGILVSRLAWNLYSGSSIGIKHTWPPDVVDCWCKKASLFEIAASFKIKQCSRHISALFVVPYVVCMWYIDGYLLINTKICSILWRVYVV